MEGGIGARWKAARAGRNFDVTGESGGVSEGVEGLPLECAVRCCQVNATQTRSLCIYLPRVQHINRNNKVALVCFIVAL